MELEQKIAVALHPPRCPECKEEIDHLRAYSKSETRFTFTVQEDGMPHYKHEEVIPGYEPDDYECPECHKTLFFDEEDAASFLMGEEEPPISA